MSPAEHLYGFQAGLADRVCGYRRHHTAGTFLADLQSAVGERAPMPKLHNRAATNAAVEGLPEELLHANQICYNSYILTFFQSDHHPIPPPPLETSVPVELSAKEIVPKQTFAE